MAINSSAFSGFYELQQKWPAAVATGYGQLQLCRTLLEFQLDGIFKTVIKSLHVCVCVFVSSCAKRKCEERMQIDLGH